MTNSLGFFRRSVSIARGDTLSKVALRAAITAAALSMAALVPSGASASTLTVDRGLPTSNLNDAAGASRSNVAWADGDTNAWVGDTFSLATASVIDKLTVWVITHQNATFGDTFNDVSLYIGLSSGSTIDKAATANFTGNTSDNANVSVSKVTYSGGATYQAQDGSNRDIWQIDFTNLGGYAAGDYMFGLTGDTPSYLTFLHASNAALGGAPADGADNLYWSLLGVDGAASLAIVGSVDSNGNGWDKSSDLNVQVFATPTPLPAGLPLFLSGIGLLGLMVFWRKKEMGLSSAFATA
jgi:hypothetical protein